jgi:hypothetical protein
MNVCMMVANPILYDGRVIRHAKTLVEAGHRVTVIGVIGPNDSDGELPSDTPFAVRRLRRQRRGLLPQAIWATTALRQRIAQKLVSALPDSVLGQLAAIADLAVATSAVELTALTIGTSYDVFHGNDLNTLPAVAWAAQLHGTPYLYDAHEFYIEESPTLTQTEKRARQLCEQRLSQRAFAVLTVNDLLADELMQRHQIARPVVVRNVPPRFQTTDPLDLPVGPTGTLRLLYHGTHIGLRRADGARARAGAHGARRDGTAGSWSHCAVASCRRPARGSGPRVSSSAIGKLSTGDIQQGLRIPSGGPGGLRNRCAGKSRHPRRSSRRVLSIWRR